MLKTQSERYLPPQDDHPITKKHKSPNFYLIRKGGNFKISTCISIYADDGPEVVQQGKGRAEYLPIPQVVLATACSCPAAPSKECLRERGERERVSERELFLKRSVKAPKEEGGFVRIN